MLKQLLTKRMVNLHFAELQFQQHIYELQNCIEVLGLEAKCLRVENNQIAVGYIIDERIFFKSLCFGQTIITLKDGNHEAIVHLFVHPSGEITVEIKPCIENAKIVTVYFCTILENTAIAIDLKGALKQFLVSYQFMEEEDTISEVHYQSMHPNVLRDSYGGNFVLGNHPSGRLITNSEEYTLANRIANLKFSNIVIYQQGIKKLIAVKMLLTFMITNQINVSNEISH